MVRRRYIILSIALALLVALVVAVVVEVLGTTKKCGTRSIDSSSFPKFASENDSHEHCLFLFKIFLFKLAFPSCESTFFEPFEFLLNKLGKNGGK